MEGLKLRANAHSKTLGPMYCILAMEMLGDPSQFSLTDALASICDLRESVTIVFYWMTTDPNMLCRGVQFYGSRMCC